MGEGLGEGGPKEVEGRGRGCWSFWGRWGEAREERGKEIGGERVTALALACDCVCPPHVSHQNN